MTALDEHSTAVQRAQDASDEDFWDDLMPEAATLVITAGHASARMLGRKMRLGHGVCGDLLSELADLRVVGADHGDGAGTRDVLVDVDELDDVLARIASDTVPLEDEPLASTVNLTKEAPAVQLLERGDVGGEVAIRPDDDLAIPYPAQVELYRATPRQQVARLWCRIVDEPAITRSVAVTRQAPKAGARLVIWTPRGVARGVRMYAGHLRDQQTLDLLAHHAERHETIEYAKVAAARAAVNLTGRRALHGLIAALAVVVGLAWWAPQVFAGFLATLVGIGVMAFARPVCRELKTLAVATGVALALAWVAWRYGPDLAAVIPRPPGWVWWVVGGLAVVGFGWLGRKEDTPLVDLPPASASTKPPIITAPMVIGALVALGNTKMRDPDSVRVLMDPHRTGPFVQIDLELPPGVTAAWVMENREELAAAMRRPMSMVWPRVGSAHPGHLVVLVSEIPMNEMEQTPWPLLAAGGPIDIFTPQPVFTDQLGDWKALTLAYGSWVIGAVPRMGKTYTVRELLLIFGMDPRVKVIGLDGKGTGDLSPLVPFLHLHVRGARVDKPEGIEKVRKLVLDLLHEMGRRADVLAGLPFEEVPDSKVTSELINAHPELDLGPIVVGMDETQAFFSYGFKANKEHKDIREEIRDGVIELMRMGPALGIWVILATQTVRDSTIPTEAQAVAVYRYGMKMESHEPNDKVLGTGAHRAGITATIFGFEEKGIGWVKGEGAKPFIGRTVYGLDAVASRTLATRIRAWRQARNLLTGEAAGDDGIQDAEVVIDIVEDTESVMLRAGRADAPYADLVDWLRELRPEQYTDLDVRELSARIRSAGVRVSAVWAHGRSHKGVKLAELRERDRAGEVDSR